jgi:hypothetical protein
MSYKPEISTDGGKRYDQNNCTFATADEAELAARDIYMRWTLATHWRVAESEQPVNYTFTRESGLQPVLVEKSDALQTHD